MRLTNIKHVFFDLDHTLWDFERNSALTFAKILKLNRVEVEVDAFLEVYVPINFEYWKLYREEKVNKPQLRYGRLRDTFTQLNYSCEDYLIDKLSEDYISYLTTFNFLFEGSIELLKYLSKNYVLHIITNGFEEAQLRKMTNSQLTTFFKTITNSEMAGVKKPNPTIFQFALEQAQAIPEQSVMIGDSLEADVLGAINVGMQAVFFNERQQQIPPDIIAVDHLLQIKDLL